MSERRQPRKRSVSDVFKEFSQLSVGDYVIHERHGIAIYDGLVNIELSGIYHDFLILIFKNDDRLYVPVENIAFISRYGREDANVDLDSLKGNRWPSRRDKIRKKLLVIANNLLQLEAKRKLLTIEPLLVNKEKYINFCSGFRHTETDDQLLAISDVLADMQSSIPMDRLICGDVGFGKTEIALRAAFIAASNGKQVVLLAPTTILVSQHFRTFSKRFADFGIQICQLSRFLTQSDFNRNISQIKNNKIKIVIGTHTLLSSKIEFSDLGLVIIDEEHHFGVRQKEKLRRFSQVHFLTLSATPIPRTLQLSMNGIRDLSLITTPPVKRLPVQTKVCEFEEADIKPAIEFELKRGGQVFFVVPRIEYLDFVFQFLREILPAKTRIERVHGQSQNLEEIVENFYNRDVDILVSTNIIDSGLDVPLANTILIYRFDLFGLSQLYQLRGRVGRADRQSFAHFIVPTDRDLSLAAQQRLELMQNLDKLGAGFTLASHDMDMRGSGNILGEEQSGFIKEVGIELYQTMLKEAILMVKAGKTKPNEEYDSQINLGVSVLIPETYIEDQDLRLILYRRIGGLTNKAEIDAMYDEITEKFGKPPIALKNLFTLIEMQIACKVINIDKLDIGASGLTFSFYKNQCKDPSKLFEFFQSDELKEGNWTVKMRNDYKILMLKKWKNVEERTKDTFMLVNRLQLLFDCDSR
ncbi:MAG: DEAD/DEAH box helicase [Holosporales bacterium]|nr:DEAD/DEAH box helicase [Holosporales bacterium]